MIEEEGKPRVCPIFEVAYINLPHMAFHSLWVARLQNFQCFGHQAFSAPGGFV